MWKLLHLLPPEMAHRATIRLLAVSPLRRIPPMLPVYAAGIRVSNPVGLAPGFDKHGEAIAGAFDLGFGFIEIGAVTPKPQSGNQKPRLFRLTRDRAVINRMGFNSEGVDILVRRMVHYREHGGQGVVGVNLAKNATTIDATADYEVVARKVADLADFVTVNISSPNTPGLRELQKESELRRIIDRVHKVIPKKTALWVKLSPDLNKKEIMTIGEAMTTMPIQGIVIANTTVSRPQYLHSSKRIQSGGLSGQPLRALTNEVLRNVREATDNKVDLIGVGGIESADDVREKMVAGASLVQLYTAMVFEGLGLPRRIVQELINEDQVMDPKTEGVSNLFKSNI